MDNVFVRNTLKVLGKMLRGFVLVGHSVIRPINYKEISLSINTLSIIGLLASFGLARTIISVSLGLRFAAGVWFSLDPEVIMTMLIFPVFLCFFPAMIIDFAFSKWKLRTPPENILGLFFYLQGVQVIIPFLDGLQILCGIPYYLFDIPDEFYYKLAISPLAATPLIFSVTKLSSLGIIVAWTFVSIAIFRYGMHWKAPRLKFTLLLMATFYLLYVVIYPPILLFFLHQNNFYCAMYFLLGAIGGILYFDSKIQRKNENN
ncbi:MAG: hypothetical protein WCX16_01705 [Candidatus Omnitrophota bacterium]